MRYLRAMISNRRFLVLSLWALFAAGLLVQGAAPHLRIVNNAFAIPASLTANGTIRPDTIVARERRMQTLSALLSLSGALGLGFYYRARRRQELRALRVATRSAQ